MLIHKRRYTRSWLIACNQVVCAWLNFTNTWHLSKMHASPVPGHRKWQSSLTNYIMHCRVVVCGTLSWNMRQCHTGSLTLSLSTILCLALGNTISLYLMKVCWFSLFSITLVWVDKYSRIQPTILQFLIVFWKLAACYLEALLCYTLYNFILIFNLIIILSRKTSHKRELVPWWFWGCF